MVVSIQVPEDKMNREDVEVRCSFCGEPISITTKPGVARRKSNPVQCEGCKSVLVLTDDDGNDLNFWWTAAASRFEMDILEMLGGGVFPNRTSADSFRGAVRVFGEEAIQRAAERVVEQHGGKPIGTWLIGDVLHLVKKANYTGVTREPAEAPAIHLHLQQFEEE